MRFFYPIINIFINITGNNANKTEKFIKKKKEKKETNLIKNENKNSCHEKKQLAPPAGAISKRPVLPFTVINTVTCGVTSIRPLPPSPPPPPPRGQNDFKSIKKIRLTRPQLRCAGNGCRRGSLDGARRRFNGNNGQR